MARGKKANGVNPLLSVRIPEQLRTDLTRFAYENHRSLSEEVIRRLEYTLSMQDVPFRRGTAQRDCAQAPTAPAPEARSSSRRGVTEDRDGATNVRNKEL